MQMRTSKAGGVLRLALPCKSSVVIPGRLSARQRTSLVRLTRGLKLNTGQWLLRFSVLRETPMTSILSIPFQKVNMLRFHEFSFSQTGSEGTSPLSVLAVVSMTLPKCSMVMSAPAKPPMKLVEGILLSRK